ncbi:MAG: ABC transporter permease [Candidatus Omnitrophica bacterium]|nr:ABC transporter permease [Candidatus Omnitrophota bacterium]
MANPMRVSAWVILGGLSLAVLFAAYIAPYDVSDARRDHSYHPPTRIHFRDAQGVLHWRPFVYPTVAKRDEHLRRRYVDIKDRLCFIRFGGRRLIRVDEPGRLYLLGTDSRGRDLFSRVLYGGRISLSLGLLGAAIACALGFAVGATAGYFGGRADQFLMRTAELFIMIPGFYLLLAVRSALPPVLDSRQIYALVVIVLSCIGWGSVARVVRGLVLSLREADFVAAARVLGQSHSRILIRHILPHTWSYVAIIWSVSVPGYILGESALSVLGLGIQEPDVSWGNLLSESLAVAHLTLHPWVLAPGIFLVLASVCFNVLGDPVREKGGMG